MLEYHVPHKIVSGVFWVGNREQNDPLRCNPYLLDFGEEALLIDPGSWLDFSAVTEKILSLTDFSKIKYIVLQHQGPDACAMVPLLEEMIPHPITIITHPFNFYFLKHYGITSSMHSIFENNGKFILEKSGATLEFFSTPYVPSPGNFITLFASQKILFSGNLLGWVGEEEWDLIDTRLEKIGYAEWHHLIISDKKILKNALEKIKAMDLEWVAPQHGSIFQGKDNISKIINRLEKINYSKDFFGE